MTESFADQLADLLWEEGKFPSGGARTSRLRCKIIVATAMMRCANKEAPMPDIDTIPREQLIAQLRKNRAQFSFYATNHRAKLGNPELLPALRDDTIAKAEANEQIVAEIDALIGAPEAVRSPDDVTKGS